MIWSRLFPKALTDMLFAPLGDSLARRPVCFKSFKDTLPPPVPSGRSDRSMDRDCPRSHPSHRWRYGKKGSCRAPPLAPVASFREPRVVYRPPPRRGLHGANPGLQRRLPRRPCLGILPSRPAARFHPTHS